MIDLFASQRAHVVPRYCTLDHRDQQAEFQDAFSRIWDYPLAWIFPPPFLIPKVLIHLNKCSEIFLIVTPKWDQVFWRPDLSNRATDCPWTIRNLCKVLVDTSTNKSPFKTSKMTLEVWRCGGGTKKLSDWTTQQKNLLMKSWRPSTMRPYKPVWARWIKWTTLNHMSVSEPTGSAFARFLSDLYQNNGLCYKTILVHKAVVSTLCLPESSEQLSRHPFVKRILKSIALASPKPSKAPVRDITKFYLYYVNRILI